MTPTQLKRKRKDLKLSQFKLSKISKVSRYNISLFESGYQDLSGVELNRIEYALNKMEKKQNENRPSK